LCCPSNYLTDIYLQQHPVRFCNFFCHDPDPSTWSMRLALVLRAPRFAALLRCEAKKVPRLVVRLSGWEINPVKDAAGQGHTTPWRGRGYAIALSGFGARCLIVVL
jgi:hypothetical protein